MSFYNVRSLDEGWRVVKFDKDLNVEACYNIGPTSECDCPSRQRPCKHVDLINRSIISQTYDTRYFFSDISGLWESPLASWVYDWLDDPSSDHVPPTEDVGVGKASTTLPTPDYSQPQSNNWRRL